MVIDILRINVERDGFYTHAYDFAVRVEARWLEFFDVCLDFHHFSCLIN